MPTAHSFIQSYRRVYGCVRPPNFDKEMQTRALLKPKPGNFLEHFYPLVQLFLRVINFVVYTLLPTCKVASDVRQNRIVNFDDRTISLNAVFFFFHSRIALRVAMLFRLFFGSGKT